MAEKKVVTKQDVEHIAVLSRLEFDDKEKLKFQNDLDEIVSYFEVLSSVDTSNVKNVDRPIGKLRDDIVKPSSSNEDIIRNAPEKNDDSFVVPRVVD